MTPWKMQAEMGAMNLQAEEPPKIISKHQKQGRGKEGFPTGFRENTALPAPGLWTSGLQKHEAIEQCCSKPPRLSYFVSTALGN